MSEPAFNCDKYIKIQSAKILERVNRFDNKLYLEFGGKLFDDAHAARVLPGFKQDIKVRMLTSLADKLEIIIAINAHDIEKSKMRSDLNITYNQEALRLYDALTGIGLYVGSFVITQYEARPVVDNFIEQVRATGVKVYTHYSIENYPNNLELIVSDEGYGKNDYIETSRPIVIVTAPGPGSGKLATCLSQLYHEYKRGVMAGYAKFETFPIHNLPLSHPVNLAYEAATVDLDDVNMIDPYHLEKYGYTAVNYNRDVAAFPLLSRILKMITGDDIYYSPTDMGVNMIGLCIDDDEAVRNASKNEIIRRYYRTLVDVRMGILPETAIARITNIMDKADITPDFRKCVAPALQKAEDVKGPAVAIELPDGRIVTGKNSSLLGAASAALINAIKEISGIPDETLLLSPNIINPVCDLKTVYLGNNNPRLHIDEVLVTLSISAQMNPIADQALKNLPKLEESQVHCSFILSQVDMDSFKKLGMDVTCEPVYQTKKLFHPKED
ncbi:MAG: DUF1846 domain-containing protein [Erysipelotrichaceae bacterium]|nr:DUF1846 domain-containing protein [Erysipelotrichaceae bacterium]